MELAQDRGERWEGSVDPADVARLVVNKFC